MKADFFAFSTPSLDRPIRLLTCVSVYGSETLACLARENMYASEKVTVK